MSTGVMAATAVDEVTSARPPASAQTETALRGNFTKPTFCLNPAVVSMNVMPVGTRAQLRATKGGNGPSGPDVGDDPGDHQQQRSEHAAEIFKAPHRLGVRVIGEDRAEQEPARCTLATVMAGSLPAAMKWHPALMLTCPRCPRPSPRSRARARPPPAAPRPQPAAARP